MVVGQRRGPVRGRLRGGRARGLGRRTTPRNPARRRSHRRESARRESLRRTTHRTKSPAEPGAHRKELSEREARRRELSEREPPRRTTRRTKGLCGAGISSEKGSRGRGLAEGRIPVRGIPRRRRSDRKRSARRNSAGGGISRRPCWRLTGLALGPHTRGPHWRRAGGRVAQRESTPFTREGSQVQSLSRPPFPPSSQPPGASAQAPSRERRGVASGALGRLGSPVEGTPERERRRSRRR